MYDAAHNPAPTLTFNTADEAIEQLLKDGFDKTDYDPIYPYCVCLDDGDGMYARVTFCNYRQKYIIEGIRM